MNITEYNIYLMDNIILFKYTLIFSFTLAFIGFFGVVYNLKSIVIWLICLEIMLFGLSLAFIISSLILHDITGQLYALFILTIAASESAIGLGLLIISYKLNKTLNYNSYNYLWG